MGRAETINAIGEGEYRCDYLYNVELIEHEIERLNAFKTELEETVIPDAEQAVEDAHAATVTRGEELTALLQQLRGQVSAPVLTALTASVTALTTAQELLDDTQARLSNAGSALNQSVDAFPSTPPVEVVTAYNAAFSALSAATFQLGDEEGELTDTLSATESARNAAQAGQPDPDQVRDLIEEARETFLQLLPAHGAAGADLAQAGVRVNQASNALPSDPSWDDAKALAEQANFYLTNSDAEMTPGVGALPSHTACGTQEVTGRDQLRTAADLMTPGREATSKEVKDAVKKLHEASTAEALARIELDQLNLTLAETDKRLDWLDGIEKKKRVTLWCADYVPDIKDKTHVGTAEVPDEYGTLGAVVIKPAFVAGEREWKYPRDGYMTPMQALSPAAYYYNRAMLPPSQVYHPQYRFGKIIKFNDDGTVNVDLIDPLISSQQGIQVIPKPIPEELVEEEDAASKSLENVAVKYMDCDVAAFLDNDEVLVWFEEFDQTKPKVIGFKKNPRPCKGVMVLNSEADQLRGQEKTAPEPDTWSHNPNATDKGFGNMGWVGDDIGLSWMGFRGRYFEMQHILLDVDRYKFEPRLWHKGKIYECPDTVLGAGIVEKRIFVAVIQPTGTSRCELWYRAIRGGTWTYVTTWSGPGTFFGAVHRPWFFSKSGLKCAGVLIGVDVKIVTLALTLEDNDVITATVTIPVTGFAIETIQLTPPVDTDTCDNDIDPCEQHRLSHTETRRVLCADYVGEDLIYIWQVERLYYEQHIALGVGITECQYVGPYPRATESSSVVSTQERFIRCPELDYERRVYHSHFVESGSGVSVVYPIPDREPPEITCCVRRDSSSGNSTTYDFTSLEYLNVTEGVGKIVEVFSHVEASGSSASTAHTGCEEIDMETIHTLGYGTSGIETITLRAYETEKPIAAWAFAFGPGSEESDPDVARAVRIINGFATPEGNTANAGKGFVVHSAKLFDKTDALPALPDAFMDGNEDRYLDHGIG